MALTDMPQPDQLTTFTLMPSCLRCGSQGMTRIKDGRVRCQGCHRWVTSVEYAPSVVTRAVATMGARP